MNREMRLEIMRDAWGPPPSDPVVWSNWETGIQLNVDFPDAVRKMITGETPDHPSLLTTFGTTLPWLEAQITWQFLIHRRQEDVREVVQSVLEKEPWYSMISGSNSYNITRITDRVADDVLNNIGRVILIDPRFRFGLFG